MALTPRTAGRFYLELDGLPCGFLRSVEGGSVKAEVVTEPPGAEHFLKKHLGTAAPEPLVLTFGLSLAPVVYDWIAEAWNGRRSARDGAIVFTDASLQRRKALAFEAPLITAVTFPTQDGSSKDPCYLAVTIQPEGTNAQKASGKLAAPAVKAKQWLACNFRVEIGGLDCKRVSKVDAFTVELKAVDQVGDRRDPAVDPKIDFPGLRFTLAESGAATWRAWHEDFVVQGNCDDAHEKSGALVVLDPGLKELGRVKLEGLGIHRLDSEKVEASKDAVARVVADLYCERMELAL
jgi:hypothetical protein